MPRSSMAGACCARPSPPSRMRSFSWGRQRRPGLERWLRLDLGNVEQRRLIGCQDVQLLLIDGGPVGQEQPARISGIRVPGPIRIAEAMRLEEGHDVAQ